MPLSLEPIALIRTDYPEKFGVPRQSGLARAARGKIELLPGYRQPEALRELHRFTHLWVLFHFHLAEGWKPLVRPPRLGGNERLGVFASRSPFRPNSLGLSVYEIESIEEKAGVISVTGVDVVDGTPVFDLKPYLPYCDALPEAAEGFATRPSSPLEQAVIEVGADAAEAWEGTSRAFRELLAQTLRQDPRPSYQRDERSYGMHLGPYALRWQVLEEKRFFLLALKPLPETT
ncbi:MAG: tRNA (N6-threonylcarbamoyladenosine(37)-N6)-methyltransferase TrmO [Verrucomicrobiota bacterium]